MIPTQKLRRDQPVPAEFAGKWVAWDAAHERIIASARTLEEVCQAADEAGEDDALFEKVPPLDVRFVGAP
jgi:hypothetical protein